MVDDVIYLGHGFLRGVGLIWLEWDHVDGAPDDDGAVAQGSPQGFGIDFDQVGGDFELIDVGHCASFLQQAQTHVKKRPNIASYYT